MAAVAALVIASGGIGTVFYAMCALMDTLAPAALKHALVLLQRMAFHATVEASALLLVMVSARVKTTGEPMVAVQIVTQLIMGMGAPRSAQGPPP